jgi:Glycosyl hydrolase catalytic core
MSAIQAIVEGAMRLLAIILHICVAALVCLASANLQACEKKGVGLIPVPFMKSAELLRTMNAHWYYDWTSHPATDSGGVPFVPMLSGNRAHLELDLKVFSNRDVVPFLLGFNEPDLNGGTKMTVDESIALWQRIEHYAVQLGSPAASTYHPDWLEQFMRQAEQEGLKVDFIAFHYYGPPDAVAFLKLIDNLREKYNRPIWITEFAVLNAQWRTTPDLYSPQQVLAFMRTVLPELERRPYVERFAWWGIGGVNPARLSVSMFFNADGSLTEVGRYYAGFEANSHDGLCGTPHYSPVNNIVEYNGTK